MWLCELGLVVWFLVGHIVTCMVFFAFGAISLVLLCNC